MTDRAESVSGPTPYFEVDGIAIYHGDCREIVPRLAEVDAVVTDPPYGIGADRQAVERGRDYGYSNWDQRPPNHREIRHTILNVGKHHIIWGGNYFALPVARGWLVWDKETGSNGYADCELAWTDLPMAVRRLRFQWMGMLQQIPEDRSHPTQKPLPVMRWCLGLLPSTARTVLDPYMGSGTTLRAAKDLGLSAIGIEAEERYCQIAAERLGHRGFRPRERRMTPDALCQPSRHQR